MLAPEDTQTLALVLANNEDLLLFTILGEGVWEELAKRTELGIDQAYGLLLHCGSHPQTIDRELQQFRALAKDRASDVATEFFKRLQSGRPAGLARFRDELMRAQRAGTNPARAGANVATALAASGVEVDREVVAVVLYAARSGLFEQAS